MRDKICRNEENGSHLLGGALAWNFIPPARRGEGWDAISVINKIYTYARIGLSRVSGARPNFRGAAATPVVALPFRKMLPGFWKASVHPIDMQTKFWIVKLAQYRGVSAFPRLLVF